MQTVLQRKPHFSSHTSQSDSAPNLHLHAHHGGNLKEQLLETAEKIKQKFREVIPITHSEHQLIITLTITRIGAVIPSPVIPSPHSASNLDL